jgi:hypothetical protein
MQKNLRKIFLGLGLLALLFAISRSGPAKAAPPNQQQIQQAIQQAQQQQQQMMQYIQQLQQQQAQRAQQMAQQMNRVAQQQAQQANRQMKNAKQVDIITEYEFVVADEGVVRTMSLLSPELDDKGRPKKLDLAEKQKLKGDSPEERKFVGYTANIEDIQVGDEVLVTLARHRATKGSPGKKKDGDDEEDMPKMKAKGKEKAAEKDDEEKPKAKAKAKDADDDEEKPKAKAKAKAKAKDDDDEDKPKMKKDKDGEGEEKEVKKIDQSMWRPVGKVTGVVSEIDAAGSRRVTVRYIQKQWVLPGQNNPNANNPNHIAIDPGTLQATLVVITKRGNGMVEGGGDSPGFGFGAPKKE